MTVRECRDRPLWHATMRFCDCVMDTCRVEGCSYRALEHYLRAHEYQQHFLCICGRVFAEPGYHHHWNHIKYLGHLPEHPKVEEFFHAA